MSFGDAASRARTGSPGDASPCPCGSGDAFGICCAPILGGASAATAERLMRSRYTAFAVGDARHLMATWHPRTRPDHVDLDPGTRWTGLRIVGTEAGSPDDTTGTVTFEASWHDADGGGVLRERSRFERRGGRWMYLDPEGD